MSVKVEIPNFDVVANSYMVKVEDAGEFAVNFDENLRKDVQLKTHQKM